MNRVKKQIVGVISATILTVIVIYGFDLISHFFTAQFGEFASKAAQLAISKHIGKAVAALLISAIVLCAIGFTKAKLIKPLYVIWGIIACIICFIICLQTGQHYLYFDDTPEIQALALSATRYFAFTFGIAFPLLHLTLCVQSCGDSLKSNLINQIIATSIFLILFLILAYIVAVIFNQVYQGITIASCLSAMITIFPALNMNGIKKQLIRRQS